MSQTQVRIPCATYRLQFTPQFTFRDATALVNWQRAVKSTAELLFFVTPRIKPIDTVTVLSPGVDLTPQPEQPQPRQR